MFCLNPWPCGWYGDPVKECTYSNAMVTRCRADSPQGSAEHPGPLLDRIDIHRPTSRCPGWNTTDCPTNAWASRRWGCR
jgi:hypothetical protein